jgi:hypothetical protein
MLTRSMAQEFQCETVFSKEELPVIIDFDDASACWKANKKSIGGGSYRYVCQHRNKNNKKCKKNPIPGCEFCSRHNI